MTEHSVQQLEGLAQRVWQESARQGPIASGELVERIWHKDGSAWSDDPSAQQHIPTALGWLHTAEQMAEQVGRFEGLAAEVKGAGFTNVFLLGMGGSSLCPEVLRQTFGSAPGHPRLTVLDTTHPDAIRMAEGSVDLARTLFLVSSKSGGTIESASLFDYFYERVKAVKGEQAGENFLALTDPGTSLEKTAAERHLRHVIPTPPEVGGRYSALTPFGLVPAALIGMDIRTLLARARTMMHACASGVPADENPGLWLGLLLGGLATRGRDKVTLIVPPSIASLGLWVEQLLAESTGKQGKGLIPVAEEPLGPPSAYGDDRVFVHVGVGGGESRVENEASPLSALEAAGHPVIRLQMQDLIDLGAEFFRWEFATAVAGTVLRIDAFDQPNVQESKDNTNAVLADWTKSGTLPSVEGADEGAIADLLGQAQAGAYVATMAYLPISDENDRSLRAIRTSIRDGRHVATTVGYGPRFLHSTGQLHKGGPNSGLFIQIVAEPTQDLDIPGQPYSFGTLIKAQSLGDFRSLQAHGRRVVRVDLGSNVAGGLARLERVVERAAKTATP
jgi:transaldolase/glucose-6-phosphate isomerase